MLPIVLSKARTHNLKGVDLEVRPGELCVLAGPSGSGKSSLALDTLYAEGQRRFVESFSPYARQFLERLDRPPMDALDPIAAGVAVDRRAPIRSSRSNVATMADLEPYLSALYACEAVPLCTKCNVYAERLDPVASADKLVRDHADQRVVVSYPLRTDSVELFLDARERLTKLGFARVKVGDAVVDLETLAPSRVFDEGKGQFEVVTDRVKVSPRERNRLAEALEAAWRESRTANVSVVDTGRALTLSSGLSCPSCGDGFRATSPGLFSYQSPVGACSECRGFGRTMGIDWDKVIPNHELSLSGGAIRAWGGKTSQYERRTLKKYCAEHGIPMDAPWKTLTAAQRRGVLEGDGTWSKGRYPGVIQWFEWLLTKTYKMHVRVMLSRYRSYDECKSCGGKRLSSQSLAYRVAGKDLGDFHALEVREAHALLASLSWRTRQGAVAARELSSRLGYLMDVGLGYLSLDRQARTLSGGEAQRVSLTAALGSDLTGALFVLDEPTVGLHATDVGPLVRATRRLAERGNAVIVIEHDPAFLEAADRIVELGPGAGPHGGTVLLDGPAADVLANPASAASRAVRAVREATRAPRAPTRGRRLTVRGAIGHNLRGLSVDLPLDAFVAVTGASGSGKSSLVEHVLYRAVARHTGTSDVEAPLAHAGIDGLALVSDVVLVDQAPLGRTSRGNAATYTGAWSRIRVLFAGEDDAERAGFGPGTFSFNVAGGRCEACAGEGSETVEMQFLADVTLVCASCGGRRFSPEVLAIRHRGRSVSDVLAMTVVEALAFFASDPAIVRTLGPLERLGLGYLGLGQPLSTLSGGEAQRLKLARALADSKRGKLFLFDEPSAGLHADEVQAVVDAIRALVAGGGSVVAVDHDLALVGAADWVVELGPGGGREGGTVVFEGAPEALARSQTRTGEAFRSAAAPGARSAPGPREPIPRAIRVEGAREHNLKDVHVEIPHGKLTVVTGPSGSGKSTLTFDVIFAEGQRRFLETLTPYARQFLPTMQKPSVERVLGVPPPIALEQRTTRTGANSTVATVTEISHYLRLLFAKVSDPTCPRCDLAIETRSPDQAFADVASTRGAFTLLAPAVEARKGTYADLFVDAAKRGITEAVVDGERRSIDPPPKLKKTAEHTIELVVFEGKTAELTRERFDVALRFGKGAVRVLDKRQSLARRIATARVCPSCGDAIPELDPRWFSFNTKQGQCESCEGSGLADRDDPHGGPCRACEGSRLSPIPRAQRLAGMRYHDVAALSLDRAAAWASGLVFVGDRRKLAEAPQAELVRRLSFVQEVGLSYLTLDRPAASLSGGEMQRLRLAAQLGSGLTGALYVLDEPTIGLHPRDTHLLLANLRKLAASGSTVLVVEHDADTIRAADHLVDLGPTGGMGGGRVMASGPADQVLADPASPTARALQEERAEGAPWSRRAVTVEGAAVATRPRRSSSGAASAARGSSDEGIEIRGAREHNLTIDRVTFPVGKLTVVCGVSGSGKSTLVTRILGPAVQRSLGLAHEKPGRHDGVAVPRSIARCLFVDQSPIGRTPRSVPATYLGIYDGIRKLFAATKDARQRGRGPAYFSFNTASGGRCQACQGQGAVSHEMSFLPDVVTPCVDCGGTRFDAAAQEITWSGHSIGAVLDLSAEEAKGLFAAHPKIARPLELMCELGIGYLKLGQGSHTLSGGEAQRLKLATELATTSKAGATLYLLDEPTTGLHVSDVRRLQAVLDALVERGDTVVVIEHHPRVIEAADWVVELGPDGGAAGGRVVAACAPRELASKGTATGKILARA
jgi:excinuclease ABC subunit A